MILTEPTEKLCLQEHILFIITLDFFGKRVDNVLFNSLGIDVCLPDIFILCN